ncbi:diguanylate cyclase (GGDEF) domain-containing protein [Haloechinothrix alba]|uniref:Diguanylate cyclase (GGDEF) domain-containing protein n=1 Tax=Haloechinothrix alba TaxID=664784 RepID=A0A238VEW5_9PSEU|nr:GGDEF domain-containing protein [Haloechinothrix alba]SNR32708.1 diguanylate cyclase (GGDEF) domain-containing protein [Haloechinothrix alba]
MAGRARELRAAVQLVSSNEQRVIISEIDAILGETQRRGDPALIANLLRSAAMGRLALPGRNQDAQPLIDELLAHSRKHGLVVQRAGAHALQGRLLAFDDKEDAALTELARALATVDDIAAPSASEERRAFDRTLASTLVDCWIVLNELAIYEVAEEVSTMAHRALRDSAGPHEITLQVFNLITMMLAWGLRLERVGRVAESREKFHLAASMAGSAEAPFAESLFRRSEAPAVEQIGTLAAAVGIASPGAAHIDRLTRLLPKTSHSASHEKPLVAIALVRCLEQQERTTEGVDVLRGALQEMRDRNAPTAIRIALERELVRLETAPYAELPEALRTYTDTLESELWAMRESRAVTLQTRREHERLSAEHGAIAAQAFQDPLTGLPNRRALDDQLRTLSGSAAAQPLSVALVDLDGFKVVNDEQSHAEGDNVLRVIASTLRDSLRGDDFVARYGGDEFIVLLPGAPASSAKAAMNRAVSAVAAIPSHLSQGVTLSIGLVSMAPHEHPEAVLSRADEAMYQAKRGGGSQVATTTADGGDGHFPAEDPDEAGSEVRPQ